MRIRAIVAGILVTSCLVVAGRAATLSSMATLAVQGAILPLVASFERDTGHTVTIQFDTGPNLGRRVAAGETADVLIAPAAVVERAVADGRVVAGTTTSVGEVAVGVAVPSDVRRPDITSLAAFRAALLAADAVVYSQGTSGVYIEGLFERLGIAGTIRAKTVRLANGGAVMERIAASRRNELGFTMTSEIRLFEERGARLLGPLPAEIQRLTTYVAGVMTASSQREAAAAFVNHITTPEARQVFVATGWEP